MRSEPVPSSADKRSAHAHWIEFCDSLKAVGDPMIADGPALSEIDLAEGLRYFAHLALASIQRYIDGADPARPLLYPLCDERIKSGGDNPDNRYFAAPVSSEYAYVLTGDFGECSYFSVIGVRKDRMTTGSVGEYPSPPELNSGAAIAGADGMTAIRISGEPGKGNHLTIGADIDMILVRATLERPPTRKLDVSIRRVDRAGPGPVPTVPAIAAGLGSAAKHAAQTSSFFMEWISSFQKHVNQLPLADQEYIWSTGGDRNIFYYLSAWKLHEGEVLVVEIPQIPPCTAWNFQLCNVWMESLDYTEARIHINGATARLDRRGGVTILVSEKDPGHPNWLRTTGHSHGGMCMRLTGAATPALVETSVMQLAAASDLAGRLSDL